MSPPTETATRTRVALVTGAESVHGRAVTETLRAAGWEVAPYDATRAADASSPVDALVLTGDEPSRTPFADLDLATWSASIDEHLRTARDASRAVLPGMIERGTGSIIAITPSSALNGTGAHHHAAAVGAVIGLVKALAREVGPHGIGVNAVAPGPFAGDDGAGTAPLGGTTTADDLGATVRYLAEERHYFAGSVLAPNGGSHL